AVRAHAWGRPHHTPSTPACRRHYGPPDTRPRPDWLFAAEARPDQADWAVWQLRFDGDVAGIEGPVDIDVARIETLREHAAIPEGEGALSHPVDEQGEQE